MVRGACAVLVVACVVARPQLAAAHHSASHWRSFYVERYLTCIGPQAASRVHCVGPNKARKALHAALHVGELAPGKNHDAEVGPASDAAVDASFFDVAGVIPELRALLAIQLLPRDHDEHTMFDKQGLRAEAAYGLAHLGDVDSAPAIAALVVELETAGFGSLWDDTLAALAVLDPDRASRYALEFLGRTRDFHTSMPGGSSKLVALDYLRADDHPGAMLERVATREEHGDDHAYCELMAARVRFDAAVHADVRKQFVGSYSGTWLAGCANAVLAKLGGDPEDAAALVRHLGRDDRGIDFGVTNIAYQRVLELIATMDARWSAAGEPERQAIERARNVLRRGLVERSGWPHVAKPGDANYSLHFVAFHQAALAGLGDRDARAKLMALLDDPDAHDGSAWLAAYWALRLGLDGAADHAGDLIVRGVGYRNQERSGVFDNIRARVLDAFAARFPDDPRWTVLLLDGDVQSVASEQALERVSRHAPAGTCDAVTSAARIAQTIAANHALLALTSLGDTCLPAIEQLADDPAARSEVRGAALEIVAALESPNLCAHLALAAHDGVWKPAIERARALHDTRCGRQPPVQHGPQPVPPRVYHQGL